MRMLRVYDAADGQHTLAADAPMTGEQPPGQLSRFVIALLALVLIFLAALVIALAWTDSEGAIGRLGDGVGWLEDHNDRDGRLILTLACVVVILLGLTVLLLELTPPRATTMPVKNVTSGTAQITTAQIAARINSAVAALPQVAECEAAVARRGKKVEMVLDLHVEPGADLAHTADEACRHAHLLVEQELGIELAAMPRARLHYRELRLGLANETPPAPSSWERPSSEERT